MGDFGYLPRDVLDHIKYLFKLPQLDILEVYDCGRYFYFCLKYQWITMRLKMVPPLHKSPKERCIILNQFINKLVNNTSCYYREDNRFDENDDWNELFEIQYIDNEIIINTKDSEIFLDIRCKDQLLSVLYKYRDMLEK